MAGPDLEPQLSPAHDDTQDNAALDLEAVLRLPQGRRVLMRILGRCGLYRNAYTGENAATNYRLGEQNVGHWLIGEIEAVGPTEYPRLLLGAAQVKDLTKETVNVLDAE